MRSDGLVRRAAVALFAVLPVLTTVARGEALTAEFTPPWGLPVTLDYWDADTFRLSPRIGGAETVVLAGRIYVVVRPSIASPARVLWVGELVGEVPPPPGQSQKRGLTLSRLPGLARAQYVVDRRMVPAMNMGLCGDATQALVASWRPEITGGGQAVVAQAGGFRLAGQPRDPSSGRPELPAGVPIEDYRVPRTR